MLPKRNSESWSRQAESNLLLKSFTVLGVCGFQGGSTFLTSLNVKADNQAACSLHCSCDCYCGGSHTLTQHKERFPSMLFFPALKHPDANTYMHDA